MGVGEFSESQMQEGAAKVESEAARNTKQFSEIFKDLAKEQPEVAAALSKMKPEEAAMVVQAGSKFDAPSAKKFLKTLGEQIKNLGGERAVDMALVNQAREQVVAEVSGIKMESTAPSAAELGKIEQSAGFESGAFVSGSAMEAAPQRMQEQLQSQGSDFEKKAALRAAMQAEDAAKIARMKKQSPPSQMAA